MKKRYENGVHDISNNDYHSSDGLSRSAICEFKRSPHHYWYKYVNPNYVRDEPSPQMLIGEYVHALVLEPETFNERYAVAPQLVEVPKVGLLKELGRYEYEIQKQAREEAKMLNDDIMGRFTLNSNGKHVVSKAHYDEAMKIAEAVMKEELGAYLFSGVRVEQSIYYTHEPTGLQCKARPDAWIGTVVTDLKTCKDASFTAFESAAYREGYFIQAAMIKQALKSIGINLEKFVFFCVEKSPSYPCVTYEVGDDALIRAENELNTIMHAMASCFEKNNWPSYESQTIGYPRWSKYEEI